VELVFLNDSMEAAPPASLEPSYTVKLMPEQPDGLTGEYPVLMTLTYFPATGACRVSLGETGTTVTATFAQVPSSNR